MIIHVCDLCGKDISEAARLDFGISKDPNTSDFNPVSLLRIPNRLRSRYEICEECGERITTIVSTSSPITTTPVGAAVVPEVP